MSETKGIIMFNRGPNMLVRILVTLYSLRKHYSGNVTFYVEPPCPCPNELDEALKYFGCNIVHLEERHDFKTLIRKTSLFGSLGTANYDKTLWLDSDVVVVGSLDGMFDLLDNADLVIPHFAHWWSDGHLMSKRVKRFQGLIDQKYIDEALKHHPAINTGVVGFKNSEKWRKFVDNVWVPLSDQGANKHIFIADEVGLQVLMPSLSEHDIKFCLAPSGYNVSVLHDHDQSKELYAIHMHGDKHVLDTKNSQYWKDTFKEMCDSNIANINSFLQYSDKRLKAYLGKKDVKSSLPSYQTSDVTIVSACDPFYVEELKFTFENWRVYKKIDNHPVIIFYNGMEESDPRLDFLRLPNVTLIKWDETCMSPVDSHRELMLSAFVIGTATHVKTDYWIKIDADSYATNDYPLYDEDFKNYAFVGPRWGYSKVDLVKQLDKWASMHWKRKLRKSTPMISEGKIEGSRFYHNVKRTISFIQFHKTRFSRFCVKLLKEDPETHLKRLPAPSHDTFYFYVIQRFDPHLMATRNFKRDRGFTQGRGRLGAEYIKQCVEQVDINIANKLVNQPDIASGCEEERE